MANCIGKKMDEDDAKVFESAVRSQYNSVMYNQLKKDRQLPRFLNSLRVCSKMGFTLKETCDYITRVFPSYCRGKGLNPKTLADIISFYPDVEAAWGFCKEEVLMSAFVKAADLVQMTEDMGDIKTFMGMFDTDNFVTKSDAKEAKVEAVSEPALSVSNETLNTLKQFNESISALKSGGV